MICNQLLDDKSLNGSGYGSSGKYGCLYRDFYYGFINPSNYNAKYRLILDYFCFKAKLR